MSVCENVNTIEQTIMIAGSREVFVFSCLYSDGTAIDLALAINFGLRISSLDNPNNVVLDKAGTYEGDNIEYGENNNIFSVTLLETETDDWVGYYRIQPYVTDYKGRPYIPAQGLLQVVAKIQ